MDALERYWSGVLQRLRADADVFSGLIEHYGERGRANELALARIFEAFLPSRWDVGTGIVIDATGTQSRQTDIVIFDQSEEPAFFAQTTHLLHPVETVVAAVEVKTTLTKDDLATDFPQKWDAIAELSSSNGRRPLQALIAYDCEVSPSTLASELTARGENRAPDLVCVLSRCIVGGSAEALGHDRYRVGACLKRNESNLYVMATDNNAIVQDGLVVPSVRHSDGKRYLGDPGRALLLFMEALTRLGASRRGHLPPVLSAYLSSNARDLYDV